jgi:hypothetical protein
MVTIAPTRRYGWRRDLPDARDLPFAVAPAVLDALPPRVDLRCDDLVPVADPGEPGTASVHAIGTAF